MRLLAIDPGTTESAYLVYDSDDPDKHEVIRWGKIPNEEILFVIDRADDCDAFAIETIQSYGMSVGQETFETCEWSGRFRERWILRDDPDPIRIYRKAVKSHLCGSTRATDSNIRAVLINRFGATEREAIGLKASPGRLYGLKKDGWAALALAVTVIETRVAVETVTG